MIRSRRDRVVPYRTLDGSEIRELMHPAVHGNLRQSVAEATIPAGARTLLHRHRETEEIYHFTRGRGRMTLGGEEFDVSAGDTVLIPPGTPHRVHNPGPDAVVILCVCAPPYSHADTQMLEQAEQVGS